MDIDTPRGRMELLEQGAGSPLVLLHPFPFAADVWSGEIEALSARRRVIAPSLRGFGRTVPFETTTAPSVDGMADDVAALLDALRVDEPVALGGLSMGGYVALAFARRHPGRLRALVLADTRAEPDDADARAKRDASIARVEKGEVAAFVDDMLAKLAGETTRAERPDVVKRIRELMLRTPAATITKALAALRDRPDARPHLGSIRVPALVLVGTEDVVTPPEAAEVMVKAIPEATLVTIPKAGHLSNVEAPGAFHEAVERFLASL